MTLPWKRYARRLRRENREMERRLVALGERLRACDQRGNDAAIALRSERLSARYLPSPRDSAAPPLVFDPFYGEQERALLLERARSAPARSTGQAAAASACQDLEEPGDE